MIKKLNRFEKLAVVVTIEQVGHMFRDPLPRRLRHMEATMALWHAKVIPSRSAAGAQFKTFSHESKWSLDDCRLFGRQFTFMVSP